MAYIFDTSKGETPQSVAERRRLADALAGRIFGRAPKNVGEGLSALGQAWIARTMRDEADQAQKAGLAQGNDAFSKISSAITGGIPASAPTAPAGPPPIPSEAMSGAPVADSPAPLSGGLMSSSAPDTNDRQAYAMNFYTSRGYSPVQAAGIVGGLKGETANLNTAQTHDGGIGLGIAGWNGDRLANLKAFAKSKGTDPTDLNTQLEFVDNELKSTEGSAYKQLQTAQTPQQAGQAMLAYFRPKDWNVPGAHPERAQYAGTTFQKYGTGNTQVASLDPTIGMGMNPQPMMPPDAMAFNGQPQGGNPLADMSSFAPQGPQGSPPPMLAQAGSFAPSPPGQPNITNVQTRPVTLPIGGQAPVAPQAAPQPTRQQGPTTQMLMQAVSNPWLNDGQRAIVRTMLEQRMRQEAQASDPLRQLQMQKIQSDITRANGESGKPLVLGANSEIYDPKTKTVIHKNEISLNSTLDPQTVSDMADQYLAGDRTVMQNLGRGQQGAENVVKLRAEISRRAREAGIDPKGIVDNFNEQAGALAGQRAVGTRAANISLAANEANNMIPIALDASQKVPRTQWMPINQAIQAVQRGKSSPELASFVAATNSLVNSYVRAVSPTGVPTDSMREHAYSMLNSAQGPEAYAAVINTMQMEMKAALAAPTSVRKELRRGSSSETDTPSAATPATAPQNKSAPQPGAVQGGYRFKGGDPSKKENWEPFT